MFSDLKKKSHSKEGRGRGFLTIHGVYLKTQSISRSKSQNRKRKHEKIISYFFQNGYQNVKPVLDIPRFH